MGFIDPNQLRYFYNAAFCMVHPSLHEGLPIAPLEAMACGLPLICSFRGGLEEACGNAAMYLESPDDSEALENYLIKLMTDEKEQVNLRTKALERAKQFSWEKAAKKTLAVYREMASC